MGSSKGFFLFLCNSIFIRSQCLFLVSGVCCLNFVFTFVFPNLFVSYLWLFLFSASGFFVSDVSCFNVVCFTLFRFENVLLIIRFNNVPFLLLDRFRNFRFQEIIFKTIRFDILRFKISNFRISIFIFLSFRNSFNYGRCSVQRRSYCIAVGYRRVLALKDYVGDLCKHWSSTTEKAYGLSYALVGWIKELQCTVYLCADFWCFMLFMFALLCKCIYIYVYICIYV